MAADAELYGCDWYRFSDRLSDAERAVLGRLRAVLDRPVRPALADYWERGEFPYEVMPPLIELDLMAPPEIAAAGAEPSGLYTGFRTFELARTDASIVTMYNAQAGLFRTVVALGGSPEQVAELDPQIRSFALTGVFALTEPEHGSDIAGGLATTARRDGDDWVLDGAKRWIGGAERADVLAVFARDVADGEVKGFLGLVVALTEQQERGVYRDQDSALAKMFTAAALRETAALAREVVGGNGITLATDVARFHADAEAVYSYEGTHEINALVVGRSITGVSAFTT